MVDDRVKTPLFFVLAVLLVCVVSFFAGRFKGRKIEFQRGFERGYEAGFKDGWEKPRPTDTIYIDRPVEVEKIVSDVVYVPVRDTTLITLHDTTYVAVESEVKRYEGENYEAQVSGVRPQLDWVRVYPKVVTITETKEAPRWSFGVTAGPGVVWNGKVHGGVGIVAGIQYRF